MKVIILWSHIIALESAKKTSMTPYPPKGGFPNSMIFRYSPLGLGVKHLKIIEFNTSRNWLILIILSTLFTFSCSRNTITITDENGILGKTNAPLIVEIKLNKTQRLAAEEGRLELTDPLSGKSFPVQLENTENIDYSTLVFNMPGEGPDLRKFKLKVNNSTVSGGLNAFTHPKSGQVVVQESGKNVLQYNYQIVY
jgi:hypothetical protein